MIRALAAILTLTLFLIANRAAFEGYFSDDDLDNLSWATVAGTDTFVRELVTPLFSESNTRPTGGLYYRWLGQAYGLQFPKFVPPLFALHLLNAGMLWWLLRRKGVAELAQWAAVIFFLFHASLLEAWWKPMYVFDLLCGTFLLGTWLLYTTRYWPAALVTFWLAYKSKEVALFFPVMLAMEDLKRAIPFFLVSLNFGFQALRVNRSRESVYTLRFTPSALMATIPFYLKHAVLNQLGALVLAPLAWFAREKEFWRYAAGSVALMVPLLFLPGRLFSVYLYVPMIPMAVGLAVLFARVPRAALALGLALFLGLDYQRLREKRKEELAIAQENQAWVTQLASAHLKQPLGTLAYYQNAPPGLRLHGMRGALRLLTGHPEARVLDPENDAARQEAKDKELPTLLWLRPRQQLSIIPHRQGEAKSYYLPLSSPESAWQLLDGWHEREPTFRWTSRKAKAVLLALPKARLLKVEFNTGRVIMEAVKRVNVEVLLDGKSVGTMEIESSGVFVKEFPLAADVVSQYRGQAVEVEFRVSPGYRPPEDGRELGVSILGFGFVP